MNFRQYLELNILRWIYFGNCYGDGASCLAGLSFSLKGLELTQDDALQFELNYGRVITGPELAYSLKIRLHSRRGFHNYRYYKYGCEMLFVK